MTNESSNELHPYNEKIHRMVYSNLLKWLGFRHSANAPIYRATGNFSLDTLMDGLAGRPGSGSHGYLTFLSQDGREVIEMDLRGVRLFVEDGFFTDLFPTSDGDPCARVWSCFIVDGYLVETDQDSPNRKQHQHSVAFGHDPYRDFRSPVSGPWDTEDYRLRVVAVVLFDIDGRLLEALVQRVPSPADESLLIP